MDNQKTLRLFPICLIACGVSVGAFWGLTLPFDGFAGVDVVNHPWFKPGQWLHLAGAIFGALGYVAIYLDMQRSGRWLLPPALLIAITGMVLFAGDAFLALVVFPVLGAQQPEMIAPDGAMFTGRVLAFYIATYAIHMTGILLLSWVMWRAKNFSQWAIGFFALGGVLMHLPPIPGGHMIAVIGGVLYGLGAVLLGWAILSRSKTTHICG